MNRLFGHFSFYSEVNPALVKKTAFKSPRWTPDYQGSFTDQAILLTSTQRFITPECHRAQMPFRHAESGCIIVADVYLTAREDLCRRLSVPCELSDAELILLSYLKWGTDLPHYLAGEFCFAIWHPKEQALFLATDQFSRRPLLYAHQPGKNFTFSNEISPFRNTCPTLTTNDNLFAHFSFNSLPKEETCYQEVFKLLPGHQLYITPKVFKKTRYWHLDKKQKTSAYKTREEYYEAFQDVFKSAVSDTLRSPYPITAHISGGLDSSSVAAQAARLLAERSRSLLGFTAKPIALEGPSYREGWVYHDMPIVQALLDRYPNIKHFTYTASPQSDIMTALQAYFPFVDQPFRNLGNMDWWLGAHDYAHENGGRVILTGTQGNGSISWAAASKKGHLSHWVRATSARIKRHLAHYGFPNASYDNFLLSKRGKEISKEILPSYSRHHRMLFPATAAARTSSHHPVALYNGVILLDPTQNLEVIQFCYNTPDWVCRDGAGLLNNRLLVRRGLSHILPDAVTNNSLRGEQAADWFLHYNEHANTWFNRLHTLNQSTKNKLDAFYDQQKYLNMQSARTLPLKENTKDLRFNLVYSLMRYMSAAFFLDYLESSSESTNS